MFKLKLYIAGKTKVARMLYEKLYEYYNTITPGLYHLECIDLLSHPESAHTDGILATPTLIKLSPDPIRKVIGDLSNMKRVQHEWGIESINI